MSVRIHDTYTCLVRIHANITQCHFNPTKKQRHGMNIDGVLNTLNRFDRLSIQQVRDVL